jgi:hypothetical protein
LAVAGQPAGELLIINSAEFFDAPCSSLLVYGEARSIFACLKTASRSAQRGANKALIVRFHI